MRALVAGAAAAVVSQMVVARFIATPSTSAQAIEQIALRAAVGAAIVYAIVRK